MVTLALPELSTATARKLTMALTNADKQRAYRIRKNPPTVKALLVLRFKGLLGHIPHERLDTMLTKWEMEVRSSQKSWHRC